MPGEQSRNRWVTFVYLFAHHLCKSIDDANQPNLNLNRQQTSNDCCSVHFSIDAAGRPVYLFRELVGWLGRLRRLALATANARRIDQLTSQMAPVVAFVVVNTRLYLSCEAKKFIPDEAEYTPMNRNEMQSQFTHWH